MSVYLLSGERFLADEALGKIRNQEATDPLAEDSFESDVEVATLMSALDTPSLLGGRRLVVLNDAHDLKKDQVEALERYLASPSPDSVLVLVASGRTKLEGPVKKTGSVIGLDAPKGRALAGWLKTRAGEHKIKLDDRGVWTLIDSVGNELRDLDAALSQLATQLGDGAKVGGQEVRSMFSRLADERIFAFTDAVGDRRLPLAVTSLRRLLEQGEPPLMVFGALSSQVRRMLRARRIAEQGARVVGQSLGLPGWRAERLTKQARSYREEELVGAMAILADTDVEMKGGDIPPEAALEQAVVRIVSGLMTPQMF
ncbi:MAG: DNA polymerase III subunit delta [Actinomycetota bacterium]